MTNTTRTPFDGAADAFDALRADSSPIAPSPAFARRLHEQLLEQITERLITEQLITELEHNDMAQPELAVVTTIAPYIVVDGAAAAIDFYVAAFGATEQHRLVGDDGRIGHAEILIGNSRMMLADEYPEADALSPTTRGGTSTSFMLDVPDVDAVFSRAIALGATELRPVVDEFYGRRQGTLDDPWGHRWSISSPIAGFDDAQYVANSAELGFEVQRADAPSATASADSTPTATAEVVDAHQLKTYGPGDLYYFTLAVKDLARAQAFFGAVLGWRFDDPDNGHVANISAPTGGVRADAQAGSIDLWLVVDDIHASAATVRELGGTADEPVLYDSGWSAECTDDQGTHFFLSVPVDKYRLP